MKIPRWLPLLVLLSPAGQAQLPAVAPEEAGFDPERLETVHAAARRCVEQGQHAGIVTVLARDEKIVDFQTYGFRDRKAELLMERDTICRIYSMTKIVTSVGALCLLEDCLFDLDDPVENYLPELTNLQVMLGGTADAPELVEAERPVSIKDLLTHTSGFVYDFDGSSELQKLYQQADLWSCSTLSDFVGKAGKLPLAHHPGEAFSYGINSDILGALIEKVSGKPFGVFLKERIFDPLGMPDTSFDVAPDRRDRLAVTYRHASEGGELEPADALIGVWAEEGRGIESGGAGLFSTAGDFTRFAQMLCNGGNLDGVRVLGRKTIELMTANHLSSLPKPYHSYDPSKGFGLGVEVTVDLGRGAAPSSLGQFGWYGAATTYCQIDPKERIVAIAFVQHFPFNEHGFLQKWTTGYFQALK
ncbi:MAG TPA: serine hydrolase [Verrucomicrobiales bacterium]|nr:serine hydrolase [Verrucomicrobiales bacterium]